MKERETELMIIAGDISSDFNLTLKILTKIEKKTGIKCLFVPGNHDIWNLKYPSMNSFQIYEKLKEFHGNLAGSPFCINNNWIVIGDIGWYDFSFGGAKYSNEDFLMMRYKKRIWKDSIYAKWEKPAPEVHRIFFNKLKKLVDQYKDSNIIFVTHMLPIKQFTVQRYSKTWNYMNAFLGSKEYGELILEYPNIKYSISGHVHYRKSKTIKNTKFICNCLGYSTEWLWTKNPFKEIKKAFLSIKI